MDKGKRPAGSVPLNDNNNNSKRTQAQRLSFAVDRLQLYNEAIGPQRTVISEPSNDAPSSSFSRSVPRPSLFSSQNTRASIVGSPNNLIQEKIRKFNAKEHITPRRTTPDMRYIKDVDTQRKHLKGVTDYLQEVGYSGVPPPRNIRALGAKDFQAMFKFLVEKILPHHVYKKKFEEEVMDIIRALHYPLIDSISPKSLLAVGALHSNPSFFALLFWLMHCCRLRERLAKLREKEKEMVLVDSIASGKLFIEYCSGAYQDVMDGNVDFEPRTRTLETKFDQVGAETKMKLDKMTDRAERLQQEYDELTRDQPLVETLRESLSIYENDKMKFIKAGEDKKAKIAKYLDQNARIQREIERMKDTRNQMQARRGMITEQWAARNTTLEEIEAVENAYQTTKQQLDEKTTQCDELRRAIDDRESKLTKSTSEVERYIQEYNHKLGMIPNTEEMKIIYNEEGTNLVDILNVDIDHVIIPELEKYEINLKNETLNLTEINMRHRERLNELKAKYNEMLMELKSDKEKILSQQKEYSEAHINAKKENDRYNKLIDDDEKRREKRKEEAEQTLIEANAYYAEKEALLITVRQEIKKENDEMNRKLEQAEKEMITSLQNMNLIADKFKDDVKKASEK